MNEQHETVVTWNPGNHLCETCKGMGEGFTVKEPCPECGAWQRVDDIIVRREPLTPRVVVASPARNRKERRAATSNRRRMH